VSTILIVILFHSFTIAQIDHIQWQTCLGTNERDFIYSIEECENGYLLGISIETDGIGISNYHDKADVWIVNIDSSGDVLWERCYGGSQSDSPVKILKVDSNNFYLLNFSTSTDGDLQNEREGEIWVVKIDSSGSIIWEYSYGGSPSGELTQDAIITPDGGLLILTPIASSGGDISSFYGGTDAWLCKIDYLGNIEWEKTYGNQGYDDGIKIKLTSDTSVLLIGGHNESGGMIDCTDLGAYQADVWILEINLNGDIINQWCYGGTYSDLGRDIIKLIDGYAFTASTNSDDGDVNGFHGPAGENEHSDIWVCKIDFDGNMIWQKCLGGFKSDYPIYITQSDDTGFIIVGETISYDGDVTGNHSIYETNDIWVVKLDSVGELEWEHCFGGIGRDWFWGAIHSIVKISDFNYVIGAQSYLASYDVDCDLYGNHDMDAWIFEIDECSLHIPVTPIINSSSDTICHTTNPANEFSVDLVPDAWGYEWLLEPEQAGVLVWDSLNAIVTWNQEYEGQAELKARSFNECGYSNWSEPRTLFLYSCLGTDENHLFRKIFVYPNPAHEYVVFQTQDVTKGEICIYNIFGKLIDVMSISSKETVWRIDKASEGLYLFTLRCGDLLLPGKFVIQR
jgi:hypothetical protein